MHNLFLAEKASQHNPVLAGEENLVVNKGQDLEASTFDLVMKKIEYDCNVWRVYKKNVEQWQHRVHQKAFEWLKKRHRHAKTTVEDMWTAQVHLLHPDQVQQATSTFAALHREFQNEGMSAANVVTVGFLNWVAPCMLKSETLEHQANQVAYLLSSNETNICPILCPQFSYQKGQLY